MRGPDSTAVARRDSLDLLPERAWRARACDDLRRGVPTKITYFKTMNSETGRLVGSHVHLFVSRRREKCPNTEMKKFTGK